MKGCQDMELPNLMAAGIIGVAIHIRSGLIISPRWQHLCSAALARGTMSGIAIGVPLFSQEADTTATTSTVGCQLRHQTEAPDSHADKGWGPASAGRRAAKPCACAAGSVQF